MTKNLIIYSSEPMLYEIKGIIMNRTQVTVAQDKQLAKLAKESGMQKSVLIRQAIAQFIESQQNRV